MRKLKTIFWDVDGTLADTEMQGHRIAFNQAFEKLKLNWHWDVPTYKRLLQIQGGKSRLKYYSKLKGIRLDDDIIKLLHNIKQSYYEQAINTGKVPLRIGVKNLVEELQRLEVNQWIVTTSGKRAVQALIRVSFENNSPFDGLTTNEDVLNHKPHPDAYIKAINDSGAKAENCIAIEDSVQGLMSANQASLPCVLTLSPWNQLFTSKMKKAVAVLNHLGDPKINCTVFHGPCCINQRVTPEYIENLIS
ncbi:HAD-IA family hydrolase [Prochlorococcus sp. MIT 1307]|uniref:HAD-IA family hydrolase n=1 Tax=Prochlorococcus sp. MIT 1307 TaxID=3096219 RepID=UPI002A74A09E|nr:HAD-IA family hydrolase [Prochlorococcus sp. MIT 1307]